MIDPAENKPASRPDHFPYTLRLVSLTLFAILLGGCFASSHRPLNAADAIDFQPATSALFEYTEMPPFSPLKRIAQDKRYQVFEFNFPATGDSGQTDDLQVVRYHQSATPGCRDLVVVLPIWGSYTYPSERMTDAIRSYSRGEVNVLRLMGHQHVMDWEGMAAAGSETELWAIVDRMERRIRNTVIDIRHLLDWADTRPELRCGKKALLGFSISALIGGVALTNDKRFDAAVFVMGGGNPGEIAAVCPGRAQAMRDNTFERFGIDPESFAREFDRRMQSVNPSRYGGRTDPRSILFIDAEDDECMPSSSRESFWQALGRPERYTLGYGHKSSFLSMTPLALNYLRRRIYTFMERQFAEPGRLTEPHQAAGILESHDQSYE